jgi:hypothetical protein
MAQQRCYAGGNVGRPPQATVSKILTEDVGQDNTRSEVGESLVRVPVDGTIEDDDDVGLGEDRPYGDRQGDLLRKQAVTK